MAKTAAYEELDNAISALLIEGKAARTPQSPARPEVANLVAIASDLRVMPRPEFRTRLFAQLEQHARTGVAVPYTREPRVLEMPARNRVMFSPLLEANTYPLRRGNFLVSLGLHAAAAALLLTSSLWLVHKQISQPKPDVIVELVAPSDAVMPVAPDTLSGGGGGGDRDKTPASAGHLPKFSMQQITPPAMVIRNDHAKLQVEPTIVMPPNAPVPNLNLPNIGDPLARGMVPSNGTGSGGGLGSGSGGGIGAGRGPGVGPGVGGGYGGGIFHVGGGVSAPRVIYNPDPEYSNEARQARYQGIVLLWLVVDPSGIPRDIKVSRSLGMGLDQKAVEAVRRWRFEPAMKDGQPVAVQIEVEVNFRLY